MPHFTKLFFICVFVSTVFSGNAQLAYNRTEVQQHIQNIEVEKALNYLLQHKDTSVQYLYDLGYVYYLNHDYQNAKQQFQEVYKQQPYAIAPNLYIAKISEILNDYAVALTHYKNLAKLYPRNANYLRNVATVYKVLKETDSAIVYITKSYGLNPEAAETVLVYANLLISKKQPQQAESLVTRYLQQDTLNNDVIATKTSLCFNSMRYKDAVFWGNVLLRRNAQTPAAYNKLGYSYLNLKKYEKAIEVFTYMDVNNMKNESIMYCAAMAYGALKYYSKSDSLLNECIILNVNREPAAFYYNAKAENAIATKTYANAIKYYDTAYYIFHDPKLLYQAGYVHDAYLNNKAQAAGYYRQYLVQEKKSKQTPETAIESYIKEFLNPKK